MAKSKKAVSKKQGISSADYAKFVTHLKKKIRSSQFKVALAVNRELIHLHWDIGKEIVERQEKDGWGSNVIDRIARDIQNEFPGRVFKDEYGKDEGILPSLFNFPCG